VTPSARTHSDAGPRFFRHREWQLYGFGLRIGWYNLRAGGLRRLGLQKTLGKLLQPIVSPTRFSEYDAVIRHLPLTDGLMLDVGSPKIFDLWLASRYPVKILATDLWDLPTAEYAPAWRLLTREHPAPGQVRFVTTDGTRTCFPAATFHCIFAISVIEHIPGDGDRRFLDEAARLLAPGGTLVLSVPFATRYEEEYVNAPVYGDTRITSDAAPGPVFFQRVYDAEAAERRLMQHAALAVQDITTLALRLPRLIRLWHRLPTRLRGVTGFLNPLLSGAAPRVRIDGFPDQHHGAVAGDLVVRYIRNRDRVTGSSAKGSRNPVPQTSLGG
jgi:SAM-dependent methyltransferase